MASNAVILTPKSLLTLRFDGFPRIPSLHFTTQLTRIQHNPLQAQCLSTRFSPPNSFSSAHGMKTLNPFEPGPTLTRFSAVSDGSSGGDGGDGGFGDGNSGGGGGSDGEGESNWSLLTW
nr:protein sym-1-like [Ipomoea batatas]